MNKTSYKKVDWSNRKPLDKCISFGDTNGNYLDVPIEIDEDTPIISDDFKENILVD